MSEKPKPKPSKKPRRPKTKVRPELSIHFGNDTVH